MIFSGEKIKHIPCRVNNRFRSAGDVFQYKMSQSEGKRTVPMSIPSEMRV